LATLRDGTGRQPKNRLAVHVICSQTGKTAVRSRAGIDRPRWDKARRSWPRSGVALRHRLVISAREGDSHACFVLPPEVVTGPGQRPGPAEASSSPGLRPTSRTSVECHDSMTALSSADPARPIDWWIPSRAQAARNIPAVYSLPR
jgi:hypothetical protein